TVPVSDGCSGRNEDPHGSATRRIGGGRGAGRPTVPAVGATPRGWTLPIILVVDGGGAASDTAISLHDRYGRSYDITVVETPPLGLEVLEDAGGRGRDVAIVLAQRGEGATDVLDAARPMHPHARRGFLLKW